MITPTPAAALQASISQALQPRVARLTRADRILASAEATAHRMHPGDDAGAKEARGWNLIGQLQQLLRNAYAELDAYAPQPSATLDTVEILLDRGRVPATVAFEDDVDCGLTIHEVWIAGHEMYALLSEDAGDEVEELTIKALGRAARVARDAGEWDTFADQRGY